MGPFEDPYLERWRAAALRGEASLPNQPQMPRGVNPQDVQMESQDFTGREASIAGARDFANALRGTPTAQGRSVGPSGIYVAPNWGQNLEVAASRALGGYLSRKANERDEALDTDRTNQRAAENRITLGGQAGQQQIAAENRATDRANELAKAEALADAEREKTENTNNQKQLDRESAERIAAIRNTGDKIGYSAPKTAKEREKFEKGGSKASATKALMDSYKDSYSAPASVRAVPGGADIENWANRTFGDKADKEAALWWSEKEKRELEPRHEMFGSAFTKPEQMAYEATTFKKTDDPSFIRGQLEKRYNMERRATERQAADYLLQNYDPERVQLHFGDVIDVDRLVDDIDSGEFQKRVRLEQDVARIGYDKLPEGVDVDDIVVTAIKHGLTVEQVIEKIREQ